MLETCRQSLWFCYVAKDMIYNMACPASPVHYQWNPIKTTKAGCWMVLRGEVLHDAWHHWIFTKALDFKPALQANILSVICSLLTAQSCFRDIFLKQAGNPHSLPKPDLLVPPPCCHVNCPSTSWAPSASKHAHELPRCSAGYVGTLGSKDGNVRYQ